MTFSYLTRQIVCGAILATSLFIAAPRAEADSYDTRQARSYISDAEYKMRQAENLRRDAEYYKRQAESNQRDAAYYTRRGDTSRAKEYQRKADKALGTYNSKMREATRADHDAADYLRRAANKLSY